MLRWYYSAQSSFIWIHLRANAYDMTLWAENEFQVQSKEMGLAALALFGVGFFQYKVDENFSPNIWKVKNTENFTTKWQNNTYSPLP